MFHHHSSIHLSRLSLLGNLSHSTKFCWQSSRERREGAREGDATHVHKHKTPHRAPILYSLLTRVCFAFRLSSSPSSPYNHNHYPPVSRHVKLTVKSVTLLSSFRRRETRGFGPRHDLSVPDSSIPSILIHVIYYSYTWGKLYIIYYLFKGGAWRMFRI